MSADRTAPTAAANGRPEPARLTYTGRCEFYRPYGGAEYLIEWWETPGGEPAYLARHGDRYLTARGVTGSPHAAYRADVPGEACSLAAAHAGPGGWGGGRGDDPDPATYAVTFTPNGGEPVTLNGVRSVRVVLGAAALGLEWGTAFAPADPDADVYATCDWTRRDVEILGTGGETVYAQKGVEAPASWDDQAVRITASKFFYGDAARGDDPATGGRESSVRQLVRRVAETVGAWGEADEYFATHADAVRFTRDLTWLCLHQHAAFNSPVWFNVGLSDAYGLKGGAGNFACDPETGVASPCDDSFARPQCAACYIQPVDDSIAGIMELAASEARLFKHGSGTGTDVSTLRSCREKVTGGGRASGPVSFMRIWDAVASTVKSGGRSRRAAKIQTINDWHPDVREFFTCKRDEDRKARALIASGAASAGMSGDPSEAYSSVMFQNSNLSVRLSDAFLEAAGTPGAVWQTRPVLADTDEPMPAYDASGLLDEMAACTWECGDPGYQFSTTIDSWHTTPASAPICSTNPCSEYVHINNSACNLASLNLLKFVRPPGDPTGPAGTFDVPRFRAAVRTMTVAQDILVDRASYPTAAIAETSHRFRQLGLGYANLGALLMDAGLPYDSDQARRIAAAVTGVMQGVALEASAELAAALGPYSEFGRNADAHLAVAERHRDAAYDLLRACKDAGAPYDALSYLATRALDAGLAAGRVHGYRNAQHTLLAPTGTIGFMMGCGTFGVEPDIALVKYKSLAGGGLLKMVNRVIPGALRRLGYGPDAVAAIAAHVEARDTIEGCPLLDPSHLAVFDCAFEPPQGGRSIAPPGHVRMMAAVQPFLSGAISKTINLPAAATPADIRGVILDGWSLGLKALAVYRDQSKGVQPLNVGKASNPEPAAAAGEGPGLLKNDPAVLEAALADFRARSRTVVAPTGPPLVELVRPRRERLPDTRRSLAHKFSVDGHEGYLHTGFYADGRLGELFVRMAKEGSTIGGLMDALGTSVSIGLQYGVPLEVYAAKFAHGRYEPAGMTGSDDPQLRFASSLTDYVFRWLALTFPGGRCRSDDPDVPPPPVPAGHGPADEALPANPYRFRDAKVCPLCGAMMPRVGNCYTCLNCGTPGGCS